MNLYQGEAYSHDMPASPLGILLINLGTPDAPTPAALRRYLAEFLWDPRVVEAPRLIWWLVLHGFILRTRPRRSAAVYQKIWTQEGSPLLVIAKRQAASLQERMRQRCTGTVTVELAMRYGNPSIAEGLRRLRQANAGRILVLPLYPQYSATTTASSFDAIFQELQQWRRVPELRFINSYHDEPGYITALAASIREQWQQTGQPDKLLFSFHGTPKRYLLAGDPYFCLCHKTARLVAEQLVLPDDGWQVVFQSIFGREEWLKPYTADILRGLGKSGVKSVDIICPGFSADCLETLEEIAIENNKIFISSGGERFNYIPALNDRPDHMNMLAGLVERHLQGWPEVSIHRPVEQELVENRQRHKRAVALGAAR